MAVQSPEREAQLPADAAGLVESFSSTEAMAPVIVVGGVKSDITPSLFYAPILVGSDHAGLSTKERFFPLLKGGLASFEDMYKNLEDQAEEVYERERKRLVVVSHSLGGLFSTELGVRRPDMVEAVVCMAGAQAGVKGEKLAAKLLRLTLGNPVTAANLQADSPLMMEHKERIASEWSPDTSLHLVASTTDGLIRPQQGLKLELPEGQEPEKRMVVPRLAMPGFLHEPMVSLAFGVPDDTELIKNFFGMAGHVNIAITPAVISYVRGVRREAMGNTEAVDAPLTVNTREPLAAAA